MATLKDTSALEALNEKDYINKLYDDAGDTQKKLLTDHFAQNTGALDKEKETVQKQTGTNVQRTYTEAAKNMGIYGGGTAKRVSAGGNAQAALSQGNQQQKNVTDLQTQEKQLDAEIERRRLLAGQQFEAEIKKAQADGDMQRAQALYDAAKKEEEQILAYRKQAAALMASRGDNSIYEELIKINDGATQTPAAGTETGETATGTASTTPEEKVTPSWTEVLKKEADINKIYDAQKESQALQLQMDFQKSASELEAQRQAQQRDTDRKLTDAYVKALQGAKNYAEVQTAYGQGSGTAAQAQLARDREMQQTLTDLRTGQLGKDAELGMKGADLGTAYRTALAKNNTDVDSKRIAALIQAAEEQEAILAENQQLVGQQYAKNGDYSILGKLYGLTPEQLRILMPPVVYDNGGSGPSSPKRNLKEEVEAATVVDSLGRPAENSAYWNAAKTAAYYGKKF